MLKISPYGRSLVSYCTMLRRLIEIAHPRQIDAEPPRRWFLSQDMDLIVWLNDDSSPSRFQFCFDKPNRERALSWSANTGFTHRAIDDGETRIGLRYKATPVLGSRDPEELENAIELLGKAAAHLPNDIAEFVHAVLHRPDKL